MTYEPITFKQNQVAAQNLLRRLGFTTISDLPFDPEQVIRKMDVGFIIRANLKRDFGIKGAVMKYGDQLQIWIDEYHYTNEPESSLLTLGEEIGHCELHLVDFDKINSIKDWTKIVFKNRAYNAYIHSQARLFGSNIILPSPAFSEYAVQWISKHVKEITRFVNLSLEGLAANIGFLMEDDIELSQWIIEYALLRWPDRAIDTITSRYPQLLRKRKGD